MAAASAAATQAGEVVVTPQAAARITAARPRVVLTLAGVPGTTAVATAAHDTPAGRLPTTPAHHITRAVTAACTAAAMPVPAALTLPIMAATPAEARTE